MNFQKKLTDIENAQKSLALLKKEILISESKSKKILNPDNSLSQTKRNSLAFCKQMQILDRQFWINLVEKKRQ